jgi:hypothetical protein
MSPFEAAGLAALLLMVLRARSAAKAGRADASRNTNPELTG